MSNTLLNSASRAHGNAGHTGRRHGVARPDRNSPREPAARCRGDRAAGRTRPGQRASQPYRKTVDDLHLPSSIRVVYGGTYAEQQQSFHDLMLVLVLAIVLVFVVLLFEFRTLAAPLAILSSALLSTSGVFLASADHAHHVQHRVVHGTDHGDRHRGQERNPAARRRPEIPRARACRPRDAMIQAGRRRLRPIVMTALAAVAGMLPLALALGAGSQMLQPLAIAVIGGITISMVLSLIITPAVHYYLSHAETKPQ